MMDIVWIAEYQANDGCYHREIANERSKCSDPIDLNGKRYYFFRYLPRRKNEKGELESFYPWMG